MPRANSPIISLYLADTIEQGFLTDTCTIQRNTQSGTDAAGLPLPPIWTTLKENVPCRYFPRSRILGQMRSTITVSEGINLVLEKSRVIFHIDEDVVSRDRLVNLRNEKGEVLSDLLVLESPPALHRVYFEVGVEEITSGDA